jgi:hypothetical protein
MRRLLALFVAAGATLLAVGCNKPQDVNVEFLNHAPYYSKHKDLRAVKALCPHCTKHITWNKKKCTHKVGKPGSDRKCMGDIKWPEAVTCSYCKGRNVCDVCASNRITDGTCFQCKGVGVLPYNVECPTCAGKKVCFLCEGSGKCDFCKEGKLVLADVSDKRIIEPDELGPGVDE